MKNKTLKIKVDRTIPAPATEVYKSWLSPKVKGTPWNMGSRLILNAKVDGFFYWFVHGTPHYGRFTKLKRGQMIQHTWMSPYTEGLESTVTVTFKKQGTNTLMTLVHSGLPDNANGRAHIDGWNQFMDAFPKSFKSSRK
jgi:uncharacterized protein YndB with AHSA1/START domain